MIPIEIAKYFQSGTIIAVTALSIAAFQKWQNRDARQMIYENTSTFGLIVIVLAAYCLLIGNRPLSGIYFGDTVNYAYSYGWIKPEDIKIGFFEKEWLFNLLTASCARYFEVSVFFTLVMFGYMFFALGGIKKWFKNDIYGALLFYIGAFSFFSYATNGIRNGLGCAIVIFAMSFVATDQRKNYIAFAILSLAAYFIHKSTALPIVCCIVALFIKSPRPLIFFWFLSIILSLVARGPIESFFTGLGFEDRLTGYVQGSEVYADLGYKSGFRPDFLLYSFMPIWLGMVVTAKTGISNRTYCILLSTYIMANSFWVMMMNAAYSNRFAYLSWFLYPIVIAYPCLRMNVWGKRQGYVAGTILLAHTGFTLFMSFIYY